MDLHNNIETQVKRLFDLYIQQYHTKINQKRSTQYPYLIIILYVFVYSLVMQGIHIKFDISNHIEHMYEDYRQHIESETRRVRVDLYNYQFQVNNITESMSNQNDLALKNLTQLQLNIENKLNNQIRLLEDQINQLNIALRTLETNFQHINVSIPSPPYAIKIEDDQITLLLKKLILKIMNEKHNHLNYLTEHSSRLYTLNDYIEYFYTPSTEFVKERSTIFDLTSFSLINKWFGYAAKYKLIFRASKDGYAGKDFYSKCGGYFPTLVIIKNNYGKVFGGYNPQTWELPSLTPLWTIKSDRNNETFMFSISMRKKFVLKNDMSATMVHKDYGLAFGGLGRLTLGNICNITDSCIGNSTVDTFEAAPVSEFIGRSDGVRFSVVDYEVFLIEN